jgi:hypothetical protein
LADPYYLGWKEAVEKAIKHRDTADRLKEAATHGQLRLWTQLLTTAVVESYKTLGWQASAKNNRLDLLPVSRSEYLSLDVIAFDKGRRQWRFPVAVAELENSRDDDKISYSLWKVLCIRTSLRAVFCYRAQDAEGPLLVRYLCDQVVHTMELEERTSMTGDTLLVLGNKGSADTFPYGYFKWWILDKNTSKFRLL